MLIYIRTLFLILSLHFLCISNIVMGFLLAWKLYSLTFPAHVPFPTVLERADGFRLHLWPHTLLLGQVPSRYRAVTGLPELEQRRMNSKRSSVILKSWQSWI